jgi:phage-related protein
MSDHPKRLPARFYKSAAGTEPVRDWLQRQKREDRKTIGEDVATVEFGWPVGMPTCRPLGDGLYEVRSDLDQNRIARVLFCIHNGHMVLLHAFIKKTQKTPERDKMLARRRRKEVEEG